MTPTTPRLPRPPLATMITKDSGSYVTRILRDHEIRPGPGAAGGGRGAGGGGRGA